MCGNDNRVTGGCASNDCGRVTTLNLLFVYPTEVWRRGTDPDPYKRPSDPEDIRQFAEFDDAQQRVMKDVFIQAARDRIEPLRRIDQVTANCFDALAKCLCVESKTVDAEGTYQQPFRAMFSFPQGKLLPGENYIISGTIEIEFVIYKKRCLPQIDFARAAAPLSGENFLATFDVKAFGARSLTKTGSGAARGQCHQQ